LVSGDEKLGGCSIVSYIRVGPAGLSSPLCNSKTVAEFFIYLNPEGMNIYYTANPEKKMDKSI